MGLPHSRPVPRGGGALERAWAGLRALVFRHWQQALRVRERLRFSEETVHLLLAGLVGLLGGLVNLVFYGAYEAAKVLALGRAGDLMEVAESLLPWQRFTAPVAGALLAGAVLHWGLRLAGRQGTSHLLEAVVAGDGRLPLRTGLVKAVSSLLSISTGASIGREGPITQLTATLASKCGQVACWPPYRLRLLVACGAASGLAAAYNAPIAGAVFAAQIVLGNFSMGAFAPLVFASVVATMFSRSFFGIAPWYSVPAFDFTRVTQLPWFLLLGLVSGAAGAVFLKLLRCSERWFASTPSPLYVRLALGGLVVGGLSIWVPEVWGNGYTVTNRILEDRFLLGALVTILLAKTVATLASVGSGAVGGVFTPTLFLGAAIGSLFVGFLHHSGLAAGLPTSAFVLVGMGGLIAATTHSPLLAMILLFEISLNYSLVPALMIACVVSALTARRLHRESVYTAALQLEALSARRESPRVGAALEQTVGDLLRPPVPPVLENATFRQLADRFLSSANNFLPVVDGQERLLGVVALQDLKPHLGAGVELSSVIASDVMRPAPVWLTPEQRLLETLPLLVASEQRNVPVVNHPEQRRLIGSIARAEVLAMFTAALEGGLSTPDLPQPPAS
jgi:CIC family chloride channel protein